MTIGERLSRVLTSVEGSMWEHEINLSEPVDLTNDGFRAAIKIFSTAIMDKVWELQEREGIDLEDRLAMSEKCGQEIRRIVKTFTDIDTQQLYKF